MAPSGDGQLLGGIQDIFVLQAKVLGQLINSDFAAAGHSGLRSVRARCASGLHTRGASVHLASAAATRGSVSRSCSAVIKSSETWQRRDF
jgi:hypothetical protein